MNIIPHLAAIVAVLWASIYSFGTLQINALGGALLILFFAFVVLAVAAIDDDVYLATGHKMLGWRADERETITGSTKMAVLVTLVLFGLAVVDHNW